MQVFISSPKLYTGDRHRDVTIPRVLNIIKSLTNFYPMLTRLNLRPNQLLKDGFPLGMDWKNYSEFSSALNNFPNKLRGWIANRRAKSSRGNRSNTQFKCKISVFHKALSHLAVSTNEEI